MFLMIMVMVMMRMVEKIAPRTIDEKGFCFFPADNDHDDHSDDFEDYDYEASNHA